ncbi:hypothetical protein [Nocardioides ungokensis]|uniref:hypothetical protein n=1 Tax=Nocardioides ungokensis TaxID=1643322 RepID=UPI0015E01A1D|nr:hypothetical protein [Nocardioides ungokensis]
MLAEVHARGVAKQELAWGSTAEWFTHLAGTHRGTGTRPSGTPTLVHERCATHAAMVAGRVSPEQAAVIVDAVDRLRPTQRCGRTGRRSSMPRPGERDRPGQGRPAPGRGADPDAAERRTEKELERQDRAAHHGRFLAIVEDGPAASGSAAGHRRGRRGDQGRPPPLTKPPRRRSGHGWRERGPADHGARLWDALSRPAGTP